MSHHKSHERDNSQNNDHHTERDIHHLHWLADANRPVHSLRLAGVDLHRAVTGVEGLVEGGGVGVEGGFYCGDHGVGLVRNTERLLQEEEAARVQLVLDRVRHVARVASLLVEHE